MKTKSDEGRENIDRSAAGRRPQPLARASVSTGQNLLIEYLVFAALLSAFAAIDQFRVRSSALAGPVGPGLFRVADWLNGTGESRMESRR